MLCTYSTQKYAQAVLERCNASSQTAEVDDPYEQRDDDELKKPTKVLSAIMKYGNNYYIKLFSNSIRYTGLIQINMILNRFS